VTGEEVTMSELHLYEGTEFEAAQDRPEKGSIQQKGVSAASPLSWLRRATAIVLLRKSYSRV
jgi:hypothetical protein